MERLTTRDIDGTPILLHDKGYAALLDRLAAYEDTGLTPEEIRKSDEMLRAFIEHNNITEYPRTLDWLLNICKAESDGRLIVLPCKFGDTIFAVAYCEEVYTHRDWETGALECPFEYDCEAEKCDDNSMRVFKTTCTGFCVDELDKKLHVFVKGIGLDGGDTVGERVFLTNEEAEAALKQEVESDA